MHIHFHRKNFNFARTNFPMPLQPARHLQIYTAYCRLIERNISQHNARTIHPTEKSEKWAGTKGSVARSATKFNSSTNKVAVQLVFSIMFEGRRKSSTTIQNDYKTTLLRCVPSYFNFCIQNQYLPMFGDEKRVSTPQYN